jgi:hypothetical protein
MPNIIRGVDDEHVVIAGLGIQQSRGARLDAEPLHQPLEYPRDELFGFEEVAQFVADLVDEGLLPQQPAVGEPQLIGVVAGRSVRHSGQNGILKRPEHSARGRPHPHTWRMTEIRRENANNGRRAQSPVSDLKLAQFQIWCFFMSRHSVVRLTCSSRALADTSP